jgi:hypothetical protein
VGALDLVVLTGESEALERASTVAAAKVALEQDAQVSWARRPRRLGVGIFGQDRRPRALVADGTGDVGWAWAGGVRVEDAASWPRVRQVAAALDAGAAQPGTPLKASRLLPAAPGPSSAAAERTAAEPSSSLGEQQASLAAPVTIDVEAAANGLQNGGSASHSEETNGSSIGQAGGAAEATEGRGSSLEEAKVRA